LARPHAAAAESPQLQDQIAETIAKKEGRPVAEVRARLDLQDLLMQSAPRVTDALDARFGGLWFDNDRGGRMQVAVVSRDGRLQGPEVESVRQVLSAAGVEKSVDLVPVAKGWSELIEQQRALGARLDGVLRSGDILTAVDPASNGLVLEVSEALDQEQVSAVKRGAAGASVPVSVRGRSPRALDFGPMVDCGAQGDGLFCDRPMRGGQFMRADFPNGRGCSEGFQVRGNTGGDPFVLTAGHCLAGTAGAPPWTTRRQTNFDPFEIGSRHSWNFGPHDYGIVRVAAGSFWQGPPAPAGRLFVDGTAETTQNERYPINDSKTPAVGQAICLTSGIKLPANNRWTDCGTVTQGPVSVTYVDGTTVTGMYRSDACGTPGSSGGPYYKDNHAFGIQSGGPVDGSCGTIFEDAPEALSNSNVHLVSP
jgi:hypothetical protein